MPTLKAWQTDLQTHKLHFLIYGLMGHRNGDKKTAALLDHLGSEGIAEAVAILNRLEFVYCVDRFSILLEDVIRFRLEDRPNEALKARASSKRQPQSKTQLQDVIEGAVGSLAKGAVAEVVEKVRNLTGIDMLTTDEIATTSKLIEMRNLVVHRGEVVDTKFIERVGSTDFVVGDRIQLPKAAETHSLLREMASAADRRLNFGG